MIEFSEYFKPVDHSIFDLQIIEQPDSFWKQVNVFHSGSVFPDWSEAQIAIIGVEEGRGSATNFNSAKAPDKIRQKLYELKQHQIKIKIVDLGNLKPGFSLNDTYVALEMILTDLIKQKVVPVILGGSQDLTYAHYNAYKNLEQFINIVGVDSRFDLGMPDDPINSGTYLGKIILQQPNFLFNFSQLGHQTYFVGQYAVDLMNKLYFDIYRLGHLKEDMKESEPVIRNADFLTFDMGAIRLSDSPGCKHGSPNGFNGEEACQIMLYSGSSDKMMGIGLYEFNPDLDPNSQSASLLAQMVWYFIEGYGNRRMDSPDLNPSAFISYSVTLSSRGEHITFYKSKKTDRWWMEIPLNEKNNKKLKRHQLVPCSYKDYQTACNNEIPERWWQSLQKIVG